ncbi:cutinase family protein [Mycolicibacterium diernhoferi]|uniref:Cutinase n=1 Tax=Mycolicibacterium diernhoferi TaxID=1801 RepID=A0A1Q4HJW2_9MYCO|nr:cutinase family protein [Mycolicibacterium diernhoferi]OPE55209.1 cutinase family protein [Mycolicibacterium diernhoferi]PEG51855.1 cutinase family protein [Mycolicibacterium diernhoferi]QYL20446.1 cutinase family protein [Mycolicibacterium diernhoferi]
MATTRSYRFEYLAAIVLVLAATMGPLTTARAFAAPGNPCPDVEVVFARGTFEAPGIGATGQAFVDALSSRVGSDTVDSYGVNYPASLDFRAATAGIADATNRIQTVAATCPDTKIVLGGYSQGAAVAGYSTFDAVPAGLALPADITGPMPPSVAPHVAAVVLFGTPDTWFLNIVDREAPPVTVGSLYSAKTVQLCAPGDPVCSPGGLDRSAHSAYKTNGMAEQAADFAARAVSSATVA